jgi:hypothetical protein
MKESSMKKKGGFSMMKVMKPVKGKLLLPLMEQNGIWLILVM